MRNMLNNAGPPKPTTNRRHKPARRQASESEVDAKSLQSKNSFKKQNSQKEIAGEDKLVGTDTKAQDYRELLKKEEKKVSTIGGHSEFEKNMIAQLLA